MKIGIIAALRAEMEYATALLENREERVEHGLTFVEGNVGGKEVVMLQSGIGKVCAAIGALEMIRAFAPDCVINTGVAGGIDTQLHVMDIVAGKEVVYHDVWCGEGNAYGQVQGMPLYYPADPHLYDTATGLIAGTRIVGGLVCSGDRFITDRKELAVIKRHFPAGLAVDMESGAIAQTCHICGVPFLSLRVISDTPGVEDNCAQYRSFWTDAPKETFQVLRQLTERL